VLSSSASCTYKVYVRWTAWTSRSTKAAYTVSGHTAGSTTKTFNQQANGGTWQLHGSYAFPAGAKVTVQLADGGGQVSADAIRVVLDTSGAVVGSSAADIVVDTSSPGTSFSGTWCDSGVKGFYGAGSLYSCGTGTTDTYRWAPTLPAAGGTFDVYVWWTAWTNRSTTVPYVVAGHSDGSTTKTFNQQVGGGSWQYHGRYTFASGAGASVEVSDKNGLASADAVLFHPIP
jgi:hypothetical protein